MRAWLPVVLVGVAGCERVTVSVPDAGACVAQSCGASVAVSTRLAPGTALTSAECDRVCASVWCGGRPIGDAPGCLLVSATSVACGATAYDCGYCIGGCEQDPSRCGSGCCDFASNCCVSGPRLCRGQFCAGAPAVVDASKTCPAADARCSLDACRQFKACGGQLFAEPRASACSEFLDAGIDLAEYCPDACTVMDAGALVQAGCSAAGDAGTSDAGTTSCGCVATRETCEQACPRQGARACLDCAAGCAIDFARCVARCD